ncbi:tellurium resistance protein TerC [Flavobacteriales bacterium]|jgi:predicted tellurium resistance membrane protein TerC|nr:tellurium resistance protein TerC [Flavobacteriales bacterium]
MLELFTLDNALALFMLILLQAVLGFDNLLYISLESKRAPSDRQQFVRSMGIGIAIFLRVGLLLAFKSLEDFFDLSILDIESDWFEMQLNLHGLIFLAGGIFIIYTAIKEIWHMMLLHKSDDSHQKKTKVSTLIIWIVVMNVVFSIDSILSAMALCDNYTIMSIAIVLGGILMIWLSGTVARFLEKNKLYEVLGLFILLIVGIMLITDGGEKSNIVIGGNDIEAMSKTTFYFVIVILVLVDIVQGRYQKNLLQKQKKMAALAEAELKDIKEESHPV